MGEENVGPLIASAAAINFAFGLVLGILIGVLGSWMN